MSHAERARKIADEVPIEARRELMELPHVHGTAVGYEEIDGQRSGRVAVRVYVDEKVDPSELDPEDRVPETVCGYPTDVLVNGPEMVDRSKMIRPATSGLALSNQYTPDGSTGPIVETASGERCVVTAKHVVWDENEDGTNTDSNGNLAYQHSTVHSEAELGQVIENGYNDASADNTENCDAAYVEAYDPAELTANLWNLSEIQSLGGWPDLGERVFVSGKNGAFGGEVEAIDTLASFKSSTTGNSYAQDGLIDIAVDDYPNDDMAGQSGGLIGAYDENGNVHAYAIAGAGGFARLHGLTLERIQDYLSDITVASNRTGNHTVEIPDTIAPSPDSFGLWTTHRYADDQLDFDLIVANDGASETFDLTVTDDGGNTVDTASFTLGPGDWQEYTVTTALSREGDTVTVNFSTSNTDSDGPVEYQYTIGSATDELQVDGISYTNSPIEQTQSLAVQADVSNPYSATATDTVFLDVGGTTVDSVETSVASGGTETVELRWETDLDTATGDYTVDVYTETGGSASTTATVEEYSTTGGGAVGESAVGIGAVGTGSSQVSGLAVDIVSTNSPVGGGEILEVDVAVENTTDTELTQDVDLVIE